MLFVIYAVIFDLLIDIGSLDCENWLSIMWCMQICNAYSVGVAFSFECGIVIADNSTCLVRTSKEL